MMHLLGRDLTTEPAAQLRQALPDDGASMLQVQQAAEAIGIATTGVRASLDTLVSEVPGPKIIHLADPDHFLVLARADGEWAQVMDGGRPVVVSREELEKRYSGHALVVEIPDADGAPRLELDHFHHTFGIAGIGQKIRHAFTATNTGGRPLTLEGKQGGG